MIRKRQTHGKDEQTQDWLDVIIIGAGASGIGRAAILQELSVTQIKIVERHEIGGTFLRWPKEMRFITPSFTSNGFGLLDLNAVTLNTSPSYSLKKEHPSGPEYVHHLTNLANYLELPIQLNTEIYNIQPASKKYTIKPWDFSPSKSIHTYCTRYCIF